MKKGVLVFMIILIINTMVAFAESHTITAGVENVGKVVTVTGNISSGAGKNILIYLTDSNGEIAHIDQIKSGANGNFAITFHLSDKAIEGVYNLGVGGTAVATPARLTFTYIKDDEADPNPNPDPTPKPEPEKATITASVENIGKVVTVTGNISSGAGKNILIYLTDSNGDIAYIDQIKSGAGGSFTTTFSLSDKAIDGVYNLGVGGTDVETPARLTFTFTKDDELDPDPNPNPDPTPKPEPEPENATITASVENVGKVVTVTGNISSGAGKNILIYLTDSNGEIAHIDQIKSGANGNFAITFHLSDKAIEGVYNLGVGGTDVETPARLTFTFTKDDEIDPDPNPNPDPTPKPEPEVATITACVENDERNVTVTGNISTGEGKQINISVTDDSNNIVYQGQTESLADGNFLLQFDLPETAKEGVYNVSISGTNTETPVNLSFVYTILRENYINVTALANSEFNVYMNITNLSGVTEDTIHVINYDATKITPVDLCGLTYEKEVGTGVITGGITIVSFDGTNGKIEYKFNIPAGKNTGTSNIIKFKALNNITDEKIIYTIR